MSEAMSTRQSLHFVTPRYTLATKNISDWCMTVHAQRSDVTRGRWKNTHAFITTSLDDSLGLQMIDCTGRSSFEACFFLDWTEYDKSGERWRRTETGEEMEAGMRAVNRSYSRSTRSMVGYAKNSKRRQQLNLPPPRPHRPRRTLPLRQRRRSGCCTPP